MKKRSFLLLSFAAIVFVFGSVGVSAQGTTALKANIPFEFSIGKTTLPAGEYTITLPETGSASSISVRENSGRGFARVLTNSIQTGKADQPNGIIFIRSGSRYYLYQVHLGDRDAGHEVVKSRKLARTEMARRAVEIKPARS